MYCKTCCVVFIFCKAKPSLDKQNVIIFSNLFMRKLAKDERKMDSDNDLNKRKRLIGRNESGSKPRAEAKEEKGIVLVG